MKPLRKYIPKRLRHFLLGWMARLGFFLGRITPRFIGLAMFSFLGSVCYYLLARDRGLTIRNLKFIFGNDDNRENNNEKWSNKKIRAVSKQVFKNLGKNIFDAIKLNTLSEKKYNAIVSHDDFAPLDVAVRGGKGGILIMAHLGCFDIFSHFFARHNYSGVAVGRAFKIAAVDEIVKKMRSGPGVYYVDRSESPREIVRRLREGRFMGALIDQDTKVDGVFADFLGHPAFTPSSAVSFAMKFKIPIIVAVTARQAGNKHHVFISEIVEPVSTGNFENDLVQTIQIVNDIICDKIREFPDQWVWMHERWKTRL